MLFLRVFTEFGAEKELSQLSIRSLSPGPKGNIDHYRMHPPPGDTRGSFFPEKNLLGFRQAGNLDRPPSRGGDAPRDLKNGRSTVPQKLAIHDVDPTTKGAVVVSFFFFSCASLGYDGPCFSPVGLAAWLHRQRGSQRAFGFSECLSGG